MVRIVNSVGTVVVEYTYDAWGNILSVTGSLASTVGVYNPFRYRGYYYDTETGFYYLQSRYYDPVVGRFLNADGIIGANGDIEGYNMFAYCNNNPIVFSDETGFALRSNTKNINDGGGGVANLNEEKTEEPTIQTFYIKGKCSEFGPYTVEYDYMYQVLNGEIIHAEIERHEITETPLFFTAQIVDNDVEIVDEQIYGEDAAIKFTFYIKVKVEIGIPGAPSYLDFLSITLFENEVTHDTTLFFYWSE